MTQDMITVLVAGSGADDVPWTAAGIEVIGRASTGDETVDLVLTDLPDVLVLDAGIGDPDARSVCRRVREWAPVTRVLTVTANDDENAYTTLVAGASGVIAAGSAENTGAAVLAVACGESLLLPRTAVRLLHDIDAWATRSADPIHPPPTLTATEREVLTRLGEAVDPGQIADSHAVTPHLVNLHAGYAVAKLQRYVLGVERLSTGR